MRKITQEQQVIDALRSQGGYATLRRLNEIVDFSKWETRTPEASVRRIVQKSNAIFRIRPGLWGLEELRNVVLQQLCLASGSKQSEEKFSHAYYQGLLVEIGKLQNMTTYIPPQDQHHLFIDQELGKLTDLDEIPKFTYDSILRKARTIDVIWFNERIMPTHFYEVEHTTDIKNSLSKFYELQDFFSKFFIVANKHRESEFTDKINSSIFSPIKKRVLFISYDRVASLYSNLSEQMNFQW